jgi:hypothetical protein
MRRQYVVSRLRGSSAHEVEPFASDVEGFAQSHEYIIGPFARESSANAFARFCDGATAALDLLSKVYKLASRGRFKGETSQEAV